MLLQNLLKFRFSTSAEAGGFEPPVRLPVRQFSKLLVSATHPNFQSSAYGNRTRVSAVRGPRPRPLDESAIRLSKQVVRLVKTFQKSGSWGIRTPGTVTRTTV